MKYTEILQARFAEIKEEHAAVARGDDPCVGVPTGLTEFDKRGGHKRKVVSLYAGASGEGKSHWKLHLMRAAAMAGHSVTVVDMEDPQERTADRDFAAATAINSARLMTAGLTDKELVRVEMALMQAEGWADNIEFHTGVKTAEEALEIFNDNPADLGVLDYLSAFPHGKHGRERSISDFMWGFTKWAQDNDSAAVAFAQVKNEVTERGLRMAEANKRRDPSASPYIEGFRPFNESDLMWCTDAGRNAKELGFMMRPGRYLKRLGEPATDNIMEFSFPKRNWGAEGVIRVQLDLATSRFTDLPSKHKDKEDQ
jgi:replicative DNA helicase